MSIVTKRTFCRFCHAACAIEADINTATNEVVAIRGDSNDPIFGSYTCIKGRHLPEQHNNAERLRTSLKRRPNGGFDEIPTAQAFDEIAERFSRILAEHGPRALASYCGTATFQNAAAHPVARAFHAAIGSPSYYTSITIDQPAKMVTPLRMGAWHAGEQPWNTADVSLIVGINIVVSMLGIPGGPTFVNPLASLREAKKNGLKLIVIDPRRTETAAMADIHLQVTPGEDPTLLAGMLRVILDEDLIDHEFCDKWVNGLPELHRSLRTFDLDHVSHRTSVPVDDIVRAARMFAAGKRGSATCGTGPNMAPRGPMIEHLAAAFNVLCGRFPREGEQVQNGTGVIGIYGPGFEPKAQVRPASPESLTNGAKARVRGLSAINGQAPTAALPDEILEPGEGQVRGLLTVGGNPVLAWPDQIKAVRALETLDTHVALDIRVSATARLAHYVIPSRLSLERPDIPTNVDRWFEEPYVMYTPALIEGGAEMVDEANLYIEIAQRMGLTLKLPGGDIAPDTKASPDDLLELAFPWARVPWAEMRATEGAKLHPELTMTVAAADPDCTSKFELVPAGLDVELAEVRAERDSYGGLAGYDPEVHTHRMASRRLKGVFNSSGREIEALRKKEGTSYAHAHPDDLAKWGVKDGDLVDISSPRSTIRTVVKAATDIKPGTISMAHSWGDLPGEQGPPADPYTLGDTTGRLSDCTTGADPITGLPVMSAIPVTVKPA